MKRIGAVLGLTTVGACSLVLEINERTATQPDATLVVQDSNATDAGTLDGNVSPPRDAVVDASGSEGFCNTKSGTFFCADFDNVGSNDGVLIAPNGIFVIEPSSPISEPNSALFTIRGADAPGYFTVQKRVDLPKVPLAKFSINLAYRPESDPEPNTINTIVKIEMAQGSEKSTFVWTYQAGGLLHAVAFNTVDGIDQDFTGVDLPAAINEWHMLKAELTFGDTTDGGPAGSLAVTVDGMSDSPSFRARVSTGDKFLYGGGVAGSVGGGSFKETKSRFDNIALFVVQR
jgi:hypothetical protein